MQSAAIDDLYLHRILGTPSSGTAGIALLCTQADRDDDGNRTTIWFATPDGDLQCMTDPEAGASAPYMHPEAPRLAFVRVTDAGPTLHILDLAGGEARKVGICGAGIVSVVDWDAARDVLLVTVERRERADDAPAVVESLPFKLDGMGLIVGNRVALAQMEGATGDCTWLVDAGGDVREARWSPDRTRLAYVQDQAGAQRQRMQLWLREADGRTRQLAGTLTSMRDLAWSPDGRRIAVAGTDVEGASQSWLHVVDADSGDVTPFVGIEVSVPGCMHWPAPERIVLLDAWRGMQRVVAVDPDAGGACVVLHAPGASAHVMSCAVGDGWLACVVADAASGPTLVRTDARGQAPREIGALNAWRAQRPTMRVEKREFRVPRGSDEGDETIEGWLVRPEGPGPYPTLLDMRGGPETHVTFDLETHVHWPVLVSRGWAILALNSVGSDSYGRAFAERLRGHWGEYDLPQYAAAVEVLREEGIVGDIATFGHSYGGFLSAWALCERMPLMAGVVSAGVIDQHSHTGTSDTGYYVGAYAMGGDPFDIPEVYDRLSPIRRAHRIQAPTLILQGMDDQRCPVGQAEQLYTTLVRAGLEDVRLVLFPQGQHHLSSTGRPSHREAWYGQLVDWLEDRRPRSSASG